MSINYQGSELYKAEILMKHTKKQLVTRILKVLRLVDNLADLYKFDTLAGPDQRELVKGMQLVIHE